MGILSKIFGQKTVTTVTAHISALAEDGIPYRTEQWIAGLDFEIDELTEGKNDIYVLERIDKNDGVKIKIIVEEASFNGIKKQIHDKESWIEIFKMAIDYYKGYSIETTGREKDLQKALKLYKEAAELGSLAAYNAIGKIYFDDENYSESLKWYELGIKNGNYFCYEGKLEVLSKNFSEEEEEEEEDKKSVEQEYQIEEFHNCYLWMLENDDMKQLSIEKYDLYTLDKFDKDLFLYMNSKDMGTICSGYFHTCIEQDISVRKDVIKKMSKYKEDIINDRKKYLELWERKDSESSVVKYLIALSTAALELAETSFRSS